MGSAMKVRNNERDMCAGSIQGQKIWLSPIINDLQPDCEVNVLKNKDLEKFQEKKKIHLNFFVTNTFLQRHELTTDTVSLTACIWI